MQLCNRIKKKRDRDAKRAPEHETELSVKKFREYKVQSLVVAYHEIARSMKSTASNLEKSEILENSGNTEPWILR